MANNKAPGLSKIRKEHLEMGGEEMDTLVTELANKITLSGVWPESLKSATICPLPKDNQARDIISEEDTRPISLLEALDKWLQKIFYNRIIQQIQYHETQAGYSLSCDHHTSLVSDFVMNRKDDAYTIAVFTDISKAFDSVPHHELINVIWDSNIPSPYKWVITSFVENRYFRVELKNSKGEITASKWRKMLFGTPQGSVLGPLLWNLFFDPLLIELEKNNKITELIDNQTNPPESGTECIDIAFADDLTLLAASKDPTKAEIILEQKLKIFRNFLETRGMEAADHKLKVMCLDPKKRNYIPVVHYGSKQLKIVKTHRFLGIHYDKDMTFKEHWRIVTAAIANKVKTMRALRGVKWGPTIQTMRVLHQAYVVSILRYGMAAWYPFLAKYLKERLEIYVRRSIRIATGLPLNTWNAALMAESDLDSVDDRAKRAFSHYTLE